MRTTSSIVLALAAVASAIADSPPATMLRYADISNDRIVFSYANGLWSVARTGGLAQPVADPPGAETFARFSPDGTSVAFLGNYEGDRDIYVTPVDGGIPRRITHNPATEVPAEWHNDGRILFTASGMSTYPRAPQVFAVSSEGGLPWEFPIPYGANPALSADGRYLAYTPHSTDMRTWKRYRGGMATDIWVFDLTAGTARRVTQWEGTDTIPMWHGSTLYYLCDACPEHRLNVWSCDAQGGNRRQITRFEEFDCKWPSIGPDDSTPGEIVFQNGQDLWVLDLATNTSTKVEVRIPGARAKLRPSPVDAGNFIESWDISPTAKRAVVEARGDIWTLPAENGVPRNLTATNGVAERTPAWSPDGKWIAWFDDSAGGCYELYTIAADGKGEKRRLTTGDGAFKLEIVWSPDSKWIAIGDKAGRLSLVNAESGEQKLVATELWGENAPSPQFSHDSSWIAYGLSDESGRSSQIFVYDMESGQTHQLTSPAFASNSPTFDRSGEWLYFVSNQEFVPKYGSMDSTWIYDDSEVLVAMPLRADVKAAWQTQEIDEETGPAAKPKKDGKAKEESPEGEKKEESKPADAKPEDSNPEDSKPEDAKPQDEKPAEPNPADDKPSGEKPAESTPSATPPADAAPPTTKRKGFEIAFDGIEARAVRVPGVGRGTIGGLSVNDKGHLIFVRREGGGRGEGGGGAIKIIDAREKKPTEKALTNGGRYSITADGKKLLVLDGGGARIVDAAAGGASKPVVKSPMTVEIDPRQEWRQMVNDAWVIFRDFFYDPHMHKVDWPSVRDRYLALVDHANSREDISYIISEMISELNVGHAYYSGGDTESNGRDSARVGLLGADFKIGEGTTPEGKIARAYQIARIYQGAPWDSDARNPLTSPSVNVKEGDFILEVNGTPLNLAEDPWAGFQGLAGRTVSLLVSANPFTDASARTVVVTQMGDDSNLRYRSWIECNRKYIDEKSKGRIGYVYVPDTGVPGQNDLMRQFVGQRGKDALIVDDRWNGGGQIPTRFIELLDRPLTNWWARRDSRCHPWPPDAHFGPKAMLINGLAGSGGDMFPWLFRQSRLGPLVGTRTWGGLVGISGNPSLVDGGSVRVPLFAFYENDGTWGVEGHGVDPDVPVIDDPGIMKGGLSRGGADPQIDVAIGLMEEALQKRPFRQVPTPQYPDRSGMGLPTLDQ